MQRVCFLIRVKPEHLEEYKKRHAAVWPDMQQALTETGWHNYSLFLRPDGLLVGYFETPDLKAAQEGMKQREVNKRWQDFMAPLFATADGGHADDNFNMLEQVFYLP